MSEIQADEGDPFIGTTLVGKYQLLELIGVGAMGRVYRAMHLGLDTHVAVKILNPDVATDAVTARRFQNEARAASRLHHPNAIAILDFGQAANGTLYIVMEMLRGRTLAQVVRDDGPLPGPRIADLLGQALAALDEAHAAGIVHRDFKPENIFVETLRSGREHVKVLDFGIAKLRGEQETSLTSAGLVCGTPDYMSPEQIRGLELDARSDVYSAGVVLYESLTGRRLFDGVTALIDVLQAHLHTLPDSPSQRRPDLAIPAAVEAVCMRALSKDAGARYASAAELRTELEIAGQLGRDRCSKCGAARQSGRFCAECGTPFPSLPPTAGVPAQGTTPLADVPTMHDASLAVVGPPPALAAERVAPASLPFCGREELLSALTNAAGRVTLIAGAPGSGKSAVAQAWIERRRAAGRTVILVEADGPGLVAPLQPLRRALSSLLGLDERDDEAAIAAALGVHMGDRAGLTALLGADRNRPTLAFDVRRRECRAAALAILRRSDADFVFEDLHLYDHASLAILDELVTAPGSVTILATSARGQVLRSPSVFTEIIELPPLPDATVAALGVSDAVIARSGGLPFVLDTELRAAHEGAEPATTAGRLARLGQDAPVARTVLDLLTVAGAPVPHSLLETAAALPGLAEAIAELARRGFLRSEGSPYRLSSPSLRREIYEDIGVERRRALHARIGAVLHRTGADVHFVAYHALLCGDGEAPRATDLGDGPVLSPVDGIAALEQAGIAARDAFDDKAAVLALRAAMERCRVALMLGLGDERQLMHIELKLGIILRYSGDLAGAEAVLREAAQLAQEGKESWALIQARRSLARIASMSNRGDRARAELNLAVKAALALGDGSILCETYLDLGDIVMRLGLPLEAEQELDEGLLLVTQGDGPEAESGPPSLPRLIARLAEVKLTLSKLREASRLIPHALRLAAKDGASIDRARIHGIAACVYHANAKLAEAAEQRTLAVAELRAVGDRRSTAEQLLALVDESAGGTENASRTDWLREAERLASEVDWSEGTSGSRERMARIP